MLDVEGMALHWGLLYALDLCMWHIRPLENIYI
jgi:hypothetical protein